MSVIDWPASLVPLNISIRPPRKTWSQTGSLTDFSQAVPAIRPPFGLTMEFDTLFGSDVLAYRALLGQLAGRANVVRVPLFDLWFAATAADMHGGTTPHSDGTAFSDTALYLVEDIRDVLVTGLQGQRTITADFGPYGELLAAGLYFGLGDHPYLCTGIWWEGSVATIRCTPSLRMDYTAEALRLRPVMLCRLKDDDTGEHVLKSLRYTAPTLDFVEVPNGYFPDTIAASLAGVTVKAAWLVTFDFTSAPMRLWRGHHDLITNDGQVWTGMGALGSLDGIEQAVNGQAPAATFTLSAITPDIMRLARDEFLTEVYGRAVYVAMQFFGIDDADDPDNERPLDNPYPVWAGRCLKPTFSYQDSGECAVQISAESLFSLRARPNAAMYTDSDQQRRFPGDLGFSFVPTLISKTVTWPDY